MIDTIVLTMNSDQFIVLDHNKFTPSSQGLFEFPFYNLGKSGVLKCFQNPKKQDALQGYYKPRLTLAKRATAGGGYALSLRIEFSAPSGI